MVGNRGDEQRTHPVDLHTISLVFARPGHTRRGMAGGARTTLARQDETVLDLEEKDPVGHAESQTFAEGETAKAEPVDDTNRV